MQITRRAALSFLGAAALLPAGLRAAAPERLYLNAYGEKGGYGFAAFDSEGNIHYQRPLPQRGHSFARSPDGRIAVAFARRPGDFAFAFDPQSGDSGRLIPAAADRSFCGHGAFTADGRLMFATEVIASTGEGVLGIYAVRETWARVGEYRTHGLDPHEVRLMPNGRTLVVANGGILMRSDLPRLKLNLQDMDPSLVYLDAADGRVIAQIRPEKELHQLSIRHIAIDSKGRVAIAMQYEGPEEDDVPLVALHDASSGAKTLRYLAMPAEQRAALQQYCGSATVDSSGRYLAVSSPRGNRVLVWDMDREELVQVGEARDICGIAPQAGTGFYASNGLGRLFKLQTGGQIEDLATRSRLQWDNHMVAVR